ncbi:MAG: hypothetical protein J2P17_14325, partial [Mycobacterium sp.]|nr:hypothetical protein [Mycobacterium sp.]
MGWYRRQTWEQTDNTRDAARAAESAERAAWQQTRLQAEATQAAWEAAANTARAADAAAEQARQQRWYQYTMWLQSPAGHRYQEWETQANQRRDRLNQYHAVWADAWLQATTQVIGPPPTREQLSAVVLGSERARRTTLWCAGVSFGLIFLNALFVHSGILFYPAALVLVVAVPVFGFRWLHLRNTDL